jgi:anti-sigma regulatory factor (Ser/Thr protein kinase)
VTGRRLLRDSLELGPLPEAVPCARLHARNILWEWGLSRLGETAEIVITELMNNAITASRALPWLSPVRRWLLSDQLNLWVLVWDANPQPPQHASTDLYAESGRGLLLVENYSTRWDWYAAQDTGGKVIWALIGTP